MRLAITLPIVLSIGFRGVGSPTPENGIKPLAEQIRAQEIAIERASGRSNGKAWLKLAVLFQNAAQYRQSERAYRRAIALLKSGDSATLADAMDRMGTMYAECGEFSKAEPLERKALAIRESAHDALGAGISHAHLSVLLLAKRDLRSAEAEAEMAVSLLVPEQRHPESEAAAPEDKMSALINLSLVRCARDVCATAVPHLRRALLIAHKNYAANSIPVGFLDFLLGYALWKSGDDQSAGESMRNGIQELSTDLGWGHPVYLRALRQYSIFLSQAGHTSEAEEIGARIATLEKSPALSQVDSADVPMGLDQPHGSVLTDQEPWNWQ